MTTSDVDADILEREAEFIINECVRFSKMGWEELLLYKGDLLYELVGTADKKIICGKAAYHKLYQIVETIFSWHSRALRIDIQSVFAEAKKSFLRDLVAGKAQFDDGDVRTAIDNAIARAAVECADRTFHLPCHLMEDKTCQQFSIGPVRFDASKVWLPAMRQRVAIQASSNDESLVEPRFREDVFKYYESFGWIASVTVLGCDPATAGRRAEGAIRGAVDIVRLICGERYSRRMRIGGPQSGAQNVGQISVDSANRINIRWSRSWMGEFLGEGWWDQLNDEETQRLVICAGTALDVLVDPGLPIALGQRFLNALSWYGDGVIEESEAARIVKYATAVETLITTRRTRGLSKRLRERVSALCFDTGSMNRAEIHDKVKSAYDSRSDLVHGSASPVDPVLRAAAFRMEHVARDVLTIWLARFGEHLHADVSTDQLDAYYDSFVANVDRFCAERAAESNGGAS